LPNGLGGLQDLLDGLGDTGAALFINDDLGSPLLLAAENEDGLSFFVYGTRNAAGDLEEIESIVVREASGAESFVSFVSGRPTHAEAANGSYVHVTYTEVSSQRLSAEIELYNAEDGSQEFYSADIDLQQTADQIAQLVEQVTGRAVQTTAVEGDDIVVKSNSRSQSRVAIVSPIFAIFVLPLVGIVSTMTIILGQVLQVLVLTVVTAIQNIVIGIFTPFFLISELLSASVFNVQSGAVAAIVPIIPPAPVIVLQ